MGITKAPPEEMSKVCAVVGFKQKRGGAVRYLFVFLALLTGCATTNPDPFIKAMAAQREYIGGTASYEQYSRAMTEEEQHVFGGLGSMGVIYMPGIGLMPTGTNAIIIGR